MTREKEALNTKLNDIEKKITDERLKCLFKYFYRDLIRNNVDDNKTLNIALNLLFGNFTEPKDDLNHDEWTKYFKSSIKERYLVIKKDKNGNEEEKYKLKDPAKNVLEKLDTNSYLTTANKKWEKINLELDQYFTELDFPIKKTLIYEAPPYLLSIENGVTNFEAEFIFDSGCSSPYVNAIRNCFGEKTMPINEILIKNGVGFFDVIPIPIPINSYLREQWATEQKFIIEGKRIFVHFFEWALDIYLFKLKEKIDTTGHKLAIGIPLKNAVTIYEYAEKNKSWFGYKKSWDVYKLDNNFCSPHAFKSKKRDGLWVQKYRNCIIGSSNTPSGELMDLAFQ